MVEADWWCDGEMGRDRSMDTGSKAARTRPESGRSGRLSRPLQPRVSLTVGVGVGVWIDRSIDRCWTLWFPGAVRPSANSSNRSPWAWIENTLLSSHHGLGSGGPRRGVVAGCVDKSPRRAGGQERRRERERSSKD